ncbi:MAG: hypothetical protein IJH64_06840 [Oscillospiraceae bacterium]|nr:hypothetical protein [Oscillospiraceae bacterium]
MSDLPDTNPNCKYCQFADLLDRIEDKIYCTYTRKYVDPYNAEECPFNKHFYKDE